MTVYEIIKQNPNLKGSIRVNGVSYCNGLDSYIRYAERNQTAEDKWWNDVMQTEATLELYEDEDNFGRIVITETKPAKPYLSFKEALEISKCEFIQAWKDNK